MNLPNGLTLGRIIATPAIALLPLVNSWPARLVAWTLFALAGITDYIDGRLARSRKQETDLGRLLDPLADKLLLVATFIPMFVLQGTGWFMTPRPFGFVTPVGLIGLPWWVVIIVLGREAFMTVFRQSAARRGVVIAAIGPAKWKTFIQLFWQGSAFFWFFIATMAMERGWNNVGWRGFEYFNGIVGSLTMAVAVLLTVYSLWLYLRRYSTVFLSGRGTRDAGRVDR